MTVKDALFALPQYVLPHHALSRLMSRLTHSENAVVKHNLISQVIRHYRVDMSEARVQDIDAYASFNDFFTRELRPGVRPVAAERQAVVSPADGVISQAGRISDGAMFQAKGKQFTVTDLLGGDPERAAPFADGLFATIYLSPRDYHRLHMPLAGRLTKMVHVPGRLFSVNAATTNAVPGLFARNERVCCLFATEAGAMALVLVGAIFVSSIETVWHGVVTPPSAGSVQCWHYRDDAPNLTIGQEMGRFNMGSTIIVLFGKERIEWRDGLVAGQPVIMGQQIGNVVAG